MSDHAKQREQENNADILVVDDNRTNLHLLVEILSGHGYQVRPTLNGHHALSSAQTKAPDLILLDILMPNMSGYEVCENLKLNERTRDIPVIFTSALHEVIDKVKAFEVGGVDYITKPFEAEEVVARVATHLDLQRLRKSLEAQNTQLREEMNERRRAEDALRKSDAELRAVFHAMHDMVFVLNREGRYLKIVSNTPGLLYQPEEAILGKTLHDIFLRRKADYFLGHLRHALDSQRMVNIEYSLLINGKELWFEGRFSPMSGEQAVFIVRDITERKWAGALLQNAHRKLEQRIREHEAELEAAQKALQEEIARRPN